MLGIIQSFTYLFSNRISTPNITITCIMIYTKNIANKAKWTVCQTGFCNTILVVLVRLVDHVEVSFRFLIILLVESVLVCMLTPVYASIPAQINPGIRKAHLKTARFFSKGSPLVKLDN